MQLHDSCGLVWRAPFCQNEYRYMSSTAHSNAKPGCPVSTGVKGQVLDANRLPVANALVEVLGRKNQYPFRTNHNGEFYRLLLPGNYTLKVGRNMEIVVQGLLIANWPPFSTDSCWTPTLYQNLKDLTNPITRALLRCKPTQPREGLEHIPVSKFVHRWQLKVKPQW